MQLPQGRSWGGVWECAVRRLQASQSIARHKHDRTRANPSERRETSEMALMLTKRVECMHVHWAKTLYSESRVECLIAGLEAGRSAGVIVRSSHRAGDIVSNKLRSASFDDTDVLREIDRPHNNIGVSHQHQYTIRANRTTNYCAGAA